MEDISPTFLHILSKLYCKSTEELNLLKSTAGAYTPAAIKTADITPKNPPVEIIFFLCKFCMY
jgi:hypothetical protein